MTPPPPFDSPSRRRQPSLDETIGELRAELEQVREEHEELRGEHEEWKGRWAQLDGRIGDVERRVTQHLENVEGKLDKLLHGFALDKDTGKDPKPGGAIVDAIQAQKLGGRYQSILIVLVVALAYAVERAIVRLAGGGVP